jgi:epoxyqueuosine reductase
MGNVMDAKEKIIEYCRELGFFDVGFASAAALDSEFRRYLYWTAENMNADMRWMARNFERRRDPRGIVPGANTVIMAGYNYFTRNHKPDEMNGKISRYAWGSDYHDILLPKLKRVASFIEELNPGARSRCYVDTGPVLERAWAVRAGLGWQGRNGCIINKRYGSWFFLGTIITTAGFAPDEPETNHCGRCRKCIDECPTGAIVSPGVVDSRKCIAYWTVEAKPAMRFPDVVKNNLKGWGFGCDICQEVCPWNKKHSIESSEELFCPRNNEAALSKEYVMKLSEEDFRERFRKSPMKRLKLGGLQRNFEYLR